MKRQTTKQAIIVTMLLFAASMASAQSSTHIQINKTNMEPTPLQTSEYADIWLEVTNKGDSKAREVRVEFNENYPYSVDPGEKTSWNVGTIIPGEEYQIHLEVKVDENALEGNNPLSFTTSASPDIEIEQKVDVEVRTDNSILSVEDVNMSDKVAPGSSERMELTLKNMADSYLKNIEVRLDLSNSIPIATENSAVKNLEKIEPGEEGKIGFNLQIDESAENGVIRLPIELAYENEAGTEFTKQTSTAVVVGGEPQLEIGVNSENQLSAGKTQIMTLRVVNRGHGSAGFTKLEVQEGENYEIISPNSVYIGEMDADDYQTAEFEIYVESGAESLSIPVELEYDAEGSQTDTQVLEPELYSSSELRKYGLAGRSNTWLLGVAALLLIAGGAYYWKRKRE